MVWEGKGRKESEEKGGKNGVWGVKGKEENEKDILTGKRWKGKL